MRKCLAKLAHLCPLLNILPSSFFLIMELLNPLLNQPLKLFMPGNTALMSQAAKGPVSLVTTHGSSRTISLRKVCTPRVL